MNHEEDDWDAVDALLSAWYRRARESQLSHYAAAARLTVTARWLGVPSTLFSAAAGTTLFASLGQDSQPALLRILIGLVAFTGAIFGALHTFLGLSERSSKHLTVGAAYGAIRREIEQLQVLRNPRGPALHSTLDSIRERLDAVSADAPTVGDRVWRTTQQDIAHTSRPEGFTQSYLNSRRGGERSPGSAPSV